MGKRKLVFSALLIVMVAALLIVSGTAAWFTAKAEVENEFTAGTVMINVDESFTHKETLNPENVNPDDCFNKQFTITNTGSKYFLLRMSFEEDWEFDWEWLWDNWDALCFSENLDIVKPVLSYEDASLLPALPPDWDTFIAYVEGLENPVKWDDIETALLAANWLKHTDGYWYYDGKFAPDDEITYTFNFDVCFDGPTMTNFFQGVDYTLAIGFEAIQASNNASDSAWSVNSLYNPDDPESGTNWSGWGTPLK